MDLISKLSVGRRLTVGFLVMVMILLVVTAIGVSRVGSINESLTIINDQNSVKQRYAINFRGSVHDRAISLRDVVLYQSGPAVDASVAEIESLAAKYEDSARSLDAIFAAGDANDEERAKLAAIKEVEQATLPLITEVVSLQRAGEDARARELLLTQAKPQFIEWLASINALIDLEEARNQEQAAAARKVGSNFLLLMGLICALGIALALAIAWLITRSITRPMSDAVGVFRSVADGDLRPRLDTKAKNGLGELGQYANAALDRVSEVMRSFTRSAEDLEETSNRVAQSSMRIEQHAQESATQADVVAAAADTVSANVNTVAAGSEEMGSSIREIATNTNEAARVASEAVAVAGAANVTVSKLGDSSIEIGNVVKVITGIAQQTNLLALNATIEAARAGEAGKGFAVVANEVKDLAQETAKSTEDISRRVEAIQADTGGAVDAIAQIQSIINQINDYQTTIASAVEEQTATTNEMNRNVSDAAQGSGQIAANIAGVATAARSTSQTVAEAQQAAADLAEVSRQLRGMTAQFTT